MKGKKTCPKCQAVTGPRTKICKKCGHHFSFKFIMAVIMFTRENRYLHYLSRHYLRMIIEYFSVDQCFTIISYIYFKCYSYVL